MIDRQLPFNQKPFRREQGWNRRRRCRHHIGSFEMKLCLVVIHHASCGSGQLQLGIFKSNR